jgi:hypothetical protein
MRPGRTRRRRSQFFPSIRICGSDQQLEPAAWVPTEADVEGPMKEEIKNISGRLLQATTYPLFRLA